MIRSRSGLIYPRPRILSTPPGLACRPQGLHYLHLVSSRPISSYLQPFCRSEATHPAINDHFNPAIEVYRSWLISNHFTAVRLPAHHPTLLLAPNQAYRFTKVTAISVLNSSTFHLKTSLTTVRLPFITTRTLPGRTQSHLILLAKTTRPRHASKDIPP